MSKSVSKSESKSVVTKGSVKRASKPTGNIEIKIPVDSLYGTGKRKEAIAKVWLFKGKGKLIINKLSAEDYLGSAILVQNAKEPLVLLKLEGDYDVVVRALGGGLSGQSDAISLGISRALLEFNPEFRGLLKENGLLTRDSRIKERKKYGRKRARKGYQFRKR
jgi:small subunit ribosomal protein S9